jgi:hypothetical protein
MHVLSNAARPLVATAIAALLAGCAGNFSQGAGVQNAPYGVSDSTQRQLAGSNRSPIVPGTANRPAEIFNQILPFPCTSGPCPTRFSIVFVGNVTADIPSSEPIDTHENAFCTGSGSCAPTVNYDSSTNETTVTYSGATVFHNRRDNLPGVHFGALAGRNQTTNIKNLEASSYWTFPSGAAPQPIVSINSNQPSRAPLWHYAVVYVAGTTSPSGGAEYATWNEIAYVAKTQNTSAQPTFTFKNYGSQPIYVTSSGIVLNLPVPSDPNCLQTPACRVNLHLLGELDAIGYPPPGSKGSRFVKLQHPPSKVLEPQG